MITVFSVINIYFIYDENYSIKQWNLLQDLAVLQNMISMLPELPRYRSSVILLIDLDIVLFYQFTFIFTFTISEYFVCLLSPAVTLIVSV